MSTNELLLASFSERICLVLLHSFWQVALLSTVAWCVGRLWNNRRPERSYAVNVLALFATVLLLPATFYWTAANTQTNSESSPATAIRMESSVDGSKSPAAKEPTAIVSDHSQPFEAPREIESLDDPTATALTIANPNWTLAILCVYALGVVTMMIRLAFSIHRASRLPTTSSNSSDDPCHGMLSELARQTGMKWYPDLVVAKEVLMPRVVGVLRPTILLPASLVTGLSQEQLRLVLSHELAHIRRHDMWLNLIQRLAESVLFFNPCIWQLSKRISRLREFCCDESAVSAAIAQPETARTMYATALLQVVQLARGDKRADQLVALAAADGRPSELRRRVARLLGEPLAEPIRFSRGSLLALLAVVLLLFSPTMWQLSAQTRSTGSPISSSGEDPADDPSSGSDDTDPKDTKSAKANSKKKPGHETSDPSDDGKLNKARDAKVTEKEKPTPQLFGESLNVMAVGISKDGRKITSVATKRQVTIRTWDRQTSKLLSEVKLETTLHGNRFLMSGMQLSSDLRYLVATPQGQVHIWDTKSGKRIRSMQSESTSVAGRALAITPDGRVIAGGIRNRFSGAIVGPPDCDVMIWDGKTGKLQRRLTHPRSMQITSLGLSADGNLLATGSQEGTACLFDLRNGKMLFTIVNGNGDRRHPDPKVSQDGASQILTLAFSPDGSKLVVGDLMGIKIHSVKTGKIIREIPAPYRFGKSKFVFSPDGRLLARVATDRNVPIWSLDTGRLMFRLPTEAHDGRFTQDQRRFVLGFSDHKQALAIWELEESAESSKKPGGTNGKGPEDPPDTNLQGKLPSKPKLAFLRAYPKLYGLSLKMTEKAFLDYTARHKIRYAKGNKQYSIPTKDDHIVIVMFGGDICTGIQRIRGTMTLPKEKTARRDDRGDEHKSAPEPLSIGAALKTIGDNWAPDKRDPSANKRARSTQPVTVRFPVDSSYVPRGGQLPNTPLPIGLVAKPENNDVRFSILLFGDVATASRQLGYSVAKRNWIGRQVEVKGHVLRFSPPAPGKNQTYAIWVKSIKDFRVLPTGRAARPGIEPGTSR